MSTIWLAFLTGLTTGGISCLAVQGGLLASSLSQSDSNRPLSRKENLLGVSSFLIFKLAAYTLLGFALGLVGSTLSLTSKVQGALQITAGLFMLATIGRLLDIHPIFRFFVIQPPKWAFKILRRESRVTRPPTPEHSDGGRASLFAPAVLGASTIFIPCGITQAMMITAVATANPLIGAMVMFAFVLGTSPIFFAVGAAISELFKKKVFVYISSAIIFIMSVLSINSGIGLFGSIYTLQNFYKAATTNSEQVVSSTIAATADGKQYATITVANNGYTANVSNLKVGVPVVLKLVTQNTQSCSRAFVIPEFNIRKILPTSGEETVEFTPTKTGVLAYSCSMGMYTGSFNIIE